MENPPPETFVLFLQAILSVETQTDLWKSKLFYVTQEEVFTLFEQSLSSKTPKKSYQPKQTISINEIMSFVQSTQIMNEKYFGQEIQKIIRKYFGFGKNTECPKQTLMKRFKPINNKLILQVDKTSIHPRQCILGLIETILSGYMKINQKREKCASDFSSIYFYFRTQLGYDKGLSKQTLKEIMYEAGIYGRINFSYLKDYIFGEDQELIGWETLLGVKVDKGIEKIDEVSEENIMSEQVIRAGEVKECDVFDSGNGQDEQANQKDDQNEKSLFLESVSEIKAISEPVSKVQMSAAPEQDYSKALNEINHIEALLSKTKQRYQKNRQNLQNETKMIKDQHLKRSQNFGKLTLNRRSQEKYEALKVNQSRQEIPSSKTQINDQYTKSSQVTPTKQWEKQSFVKKTQAKPVITQSPYQNLKLNQTPVQKSSVRPLMTREDMKKQITETLLQSKCSQRPSNQGTERRQAGKIKRRSVSKDVQKLNQVQSEHSSSTISNYNEYEAVLKEIKRQQNSYKRMVEEREKILYERQNKQRLDLSASLSSFKKFTPSNSRVEEIYSSTSSSIYKQTPFQSHRRSPSQGRYPDIMKSIDTNNLSRSRVSSRKREQIVQKATSEARLKIQEIQNRALKRLAKIDGQTCEPRPSIKHTNYLQLQTQKPQIPKYKQTKQNLTVKSPQSKNLFINQLLNERPALKLYSTSYKQKY